MADDRPNKEGAEKEGAKVRAEAAESENASAKRKPMVDTALGYLNNGFVLLIIGAAITSGMVPYFQRKYEARKQQYSQMQECLTQFMIYGNSIWEEYYAVIPLSLELEIDKQQYVRYTKQITAIKLKRYDAYAKVQALAVVFGIEEKTRSNDVKKALKNYAVTLNTASEAIDKWLTALYCTPTVRDESPCTSFDPSFDSFSEYEKLKKQVLDVGNQESDNVAAIIVAKMNE